MIKRIEALIAAATPGPWSTNITSQWKLVTGREEERETGNIRPILLEIGGQGIDADLTLSAHARQLLPLMLNVVKQAEILREVAGWMFIHPDIAPKLHFSERYEEIVSTLDSYDRTYHDLDAYCADHLPEAS